MKSPPSILWADEDAQGVDFGLISAIRLMWVSSACSSRANLLQTRLQRGSNVDVSGAALAASRREFLRLGTPKDGHREDGHCRSIVWLFLQQLIERGLRVRDDNSLFGHSLVGIHFGRESRPSRRSFR